MKWSKQRRLQQVPLGQIVCEGFLVAIECAESLSNLLVCSYVSLELCTALWRMSENARSLDSTNWPEHNTRTFTSSQRDQVSSVTSIKSKYWVSCSVSACDSVRGSSSRKKGWNQRQHTQWINEKAEEHQSGRLHREGYNQFWNKAQARAKKVKH